MQHTVLLFDTASSNLRSGYSTTTQTVETAWLCLSLAVKIPQYTYVISPGMHKVWLQAECVYSGCTDDAIVLIFFSKVLVTIFISKTHNHL